MPYAHHPLAGWAVELRLYRNFAHMPMPHVLCHCFPRAVEDFSLLRKLYEGSLSVVCQAQHRKSGRHVALKIYKRSRLHEMERFQVGARGQFKQPGYICFMVSRGTQARSFV
jgi:hypothetical protein